MRLRAQARKLIAESKTKSVVSLESPSKTSQRITLSPERTISPINNGEFIYNVRKSSPIKESTIKKNDENKGHCPSPTKILSPFNEKNDGRVNL